MKDFTMSMALFDYIPVTMFFLGMLRIALDLKRKMTPATKILCWAGVVLTTCAGALKATYKFTIAAGLGEHKWLANQFFQNLSLGFLLLGAAFTFTTLRKSAKHTQAAEYAESSETPENTENTEESSEERTNALFPTGLLIGTVIVGMTAAYAALCYYAAKLKNKVAIAVLIVSYFLCLGMGYLASQDTTTASMVWTEQLVNAGAQLTFLISCLMLHKSGLDKA